MAYDPSFELFVAQNLALQGGGSAYRGSAVPGDAGADYALRSSFAALLLRSSFGVPLQATVPFCST